MKETMSHSGKLSMGHDTRQNWFNFYVSLLLHGLISMGQCHPQALSNGAFEI